jgi:tRNA(Ile)-lysidine synthase
MTPEAFRAATQALAGPTFGPDARLAVAVSGGPDSLALMRLAASAFPDRTQVLSVDHRLRPESAGECAMVERLATRLGLPHATLLPARPIAGASVQAQARAARYAAMKVWCTDHGVRFLMTAHHADDQAETLLMRLARGSGLAGLAGIRPVRALGESVTLLRPLLQCRKSDLVALVAAEGWQAVDDPANRSARHDRTRARALLSGTDWLEAPRLAASARHMADAQSALEWAAERAFRSRSARQGEALLLDPEALPAELRRRLLLRGLEALGCEAPKGPDLARLLARLEAGGAGTLGPVRASAEAAGHWRLEPAPARRR